MACFVVPMGEAVVTTIAKKSLKKHENLSEKLGILNKMLWGGSGLLAFEHLWHGEISPFFPFLTAAADASDRAQMLSEMATTGSAMALLVTVVWGVVIIMSDKIRKRNVSSNSSKEVTTT